MFNGWSFGCLSGMGMSPNQASMNPLMGATREGHLLVVHLLVQAGANLETLDKNQFTPLMLAVQNKHNALVKYLIKAGAAVGFKVRKRHCSKNSIVFVMMVVAK